MRPSIKLLTWGITPVKDNKIRFQYDYKSIFLSFPLLNNIDYIFLKQNFFKYFAFKEWLVIFYFLSNRNTITSILYWININHWFIDII